MLGRILASAQVPQLGSNRPVYGQRQEHIAGQPFGKVAGRCQHGFRRVQTQHHSARLRRNIRDPTPTRLKNICCSQSAESSKYTHAAEPVCSLVCCHRRHAQDALHASSRQKSCPVAAQTGGPEACPRDSLEHGRGSKPDSRADQPASEESTPLSFGIKAAVAEGPAARCKAAKPDCISVSQIPAACPLLPSTYVFAVPAIPVVDANLVQLVPPLNLV